MQKTELFNTHTFIKELVNAGMDEKQAEVLAEHQLSMLEAHIATKADIADVKQDISTMKSDISVNFEWIKRVLIGLCITSGIALLKYIFA
ncbi:hypothetical protein AB4427_05980 [Vibrio artabrorum]|uniref:hypothetical protein n=1 Tax=Vibrio artabrorum TaxID=446374 RepID=UPI00355166F1